MPRMARVVLLYFPHQCGAAQAELAGGCFRDGGLRTVPVGPAGAAQCAGYSRVCVPSDDQPCAEAVGPRRGGGRHGPSDEGLGGVYDTVSQPAGEAMRHRAVRPVQVEPGAHGHVPARLDAVR